MSKHAIPPENRERPRLLEEYSKDIPSTHRLTRGEDSCVSIEERSFAAESRLCIHCDPSLKKTPLDRSLITAQAVHRIS